MASIFRHQRLPHGYHEIHSGLSYVAFPDTLSRYHRIGLRFFRATYIPKKIFRFARLLKGSFLLSAGLRCKPQNLLSPRPTTMQWESPVGSYP